MADHKFKIGKARIFAKKSRTFRIDVPSGSCQTIRRMPATDGEFQYVVRSAHEGHERVARESELSSF